ncbi:MAG: metallophosphoesterase [Planctomycetes bacterium]|nr:metallophosphoesterase [Planctomycetota bacterium]
MGEVVVVIPDIHGNLDALESVLTLAGNSKLVFLGDYVDRGERSAEVLRRVRALTERGHTALLGNHEEMLLDYVHGGGKYWLTSHIGGQTTVQSFVAEAGRGFGRPGELHDYLKRDGMLDWLENLPRTVTFGDIIFSHGPISPCGADSNPTGNRPVANTEQAWSEALGEPGRGFVVCGHVPTLPDSQREGLSAFEPGPSGPLIELLCSDPAAQHDRKPMLFPHGLYLDCGCGSIDGAPLYAARLQY